MKQSIHDITGNFFSRLRSNTFLNNYTKLFLRLRNKIFLYSNAKVLSGLMKIFLHNCAKVLSYYLVYFPRKSIYNFKDVQAMVLTIGFPRSGSSSIGFILTAHPNIVISDEATVDAKEGYNRTIKTMDELRRPEVPYLYLADLDRVFDYLLCVDRLRYLLGRSIFNYKKSHNVKRGTDRTVRYQFIPNQCQGGFQTLQVIGNKHSESNVKNLNKEDVLKKIRSRLENKKISLKFIFTIRNPYDMVATDLQEWQLQGLWRNLENSIKFISNCCEKNINILRQINSDDVFICKNEDMIENPKLQISKLCDFLQVSASTDYINACAAQVISKTTKSRFKIDWSDEHKQEVASWIEKYDFFSGYDWQS